MSLSHGTVPAATDNEPTEGTPRHQHASRHRPGLLRLCIIESCERFAATSLGSLLVLYMTEERGASPSEALQLVGNFNALCYVAPIVGGAVSDRILGASRALQVGVLLMTAAYSVLALGLSSLLLVLLLLVAGHGFFKPSINMLLSSLHPVGDHRRERAHSWFYFAANLGAMLAPLVTGLVRARSGFDVVFSVAASSMTLGIFAMFAGARLPRSNGPMLARASTEQTPLRAGITSHETDIVAFLALCATVVVAGAAVAQCNGVLLLMARDEVHRVVFGREIPVSWFAALPALLVLAVGPLLTFVDGQAARGGQVVSARNKILAGLRCIGLAFLLLAVVSRWRQHGELIGSAWIVTAYLLLTFGELLIIPLTQALLVELVPPAKTGLASGLWFAALAGGHWSAGALGSWWSTLPHEHFFAGSALLVSVVGILARRYLRDVRSR